MLLLLLLSFSVKIIGLSVEIDLLELYNTLDTFDKKIVTFINDPDCTLRDDFIQWLEKYNANLCQLVSYLNNNEVRAESIARKLLNKDGPEFLKVKIDTEYLKERLFWGEADIEEMYYNIGATKVLWFEMKNVLSPYGERHLRNINVPWELYELDVRGRLNEDVHFTNTDDIKTKTNISCNSSNYDY